jgi:predicted transposase/invertase (TIGR01784 family)
MQEKKYILPLTGFGFQKLFGRESDKYLLIDFLNELLGKDEGRIIQITYLSEEEIGRYYNSDFIGVYCENEKGDKFIVEIQKAAANFFKNKSDYFSSFPIQSHAEKIPSDLEVKSVYTVGILDFIFRENKNDKELFHHEIQLIDKNTQKVFFDKLTHIYIELPKFKKAENELESHFDKWLYLLKNLVYLTKRPAKFQEKIFGKLFEQAEIENSRIKKYDEYEASLKAYRDLKNVINTAFEEGKKKGRMKRKIEEL